MKSTAKFPLIVKTSFGFEDLLADELQALGARQIKKMTRAVEVEGDKELMYSINLWSRVALRVLKPVATFPAGSEEALYDGMKKTDWSQYMDAEDTLAIDAVVSQSTLTHSLYVAQKSKDAVADQFRNRTGQRPSVDLRRPTLRLHIHLSRDIASVSLDSSGESLHRRGYRLASMEAPLNETLAAGMILMSGWDFRSSLLDMMCGSGTIPIEAAMLARNIAPGLLRSGYGFENWKDFDDELWSRLLAEARQKQRNSLSFRVTGLDRSRDAIKIARENAVRAGVEGDIDFINTNFEAYTPDEIPSIIITNPPYGGRITDEDLFALYKEMGDAFKKKYSGASAWVLTANREASHKIGLKPSRKIPLFNGALECRFLKFEMYSGTKKVKHDESGG